MGALQSFCRFPALTNRRYLWKFLLLFLWLNERQYLGNYIWKSYFRLMGNSFLFFFFRKKELHWFATGASSHSILPLQWVFTGIWFSRSIAFLYSCSPLFICKLPTDIFFLIMQSVAYTNKNKFHLFRQPVVSKWAKLVWPASSQTLTTMLLINHKMFLSSDLFFFLYVKSQRCKKFKFCFKSVPSRQSPNSCCRQVAHKQMTVRYFSEIKPPVSSYTNL